MKKIILITLMTVAILGNTFSTNARDLGPAGNGILNKGGLKRFDAQELESYVTASDIIAKSSNQNQLPISGKKTFLKAFDGYKITQAVRVTEKEGEAFYIAAENDKESIIVKINERFEVTTFKKAKD